MTAHVKVSSTYKEIIEKHVNVSGTWKEILQGFERVGGVWKQFYATLCTLGTLTFEGLVDGAVSPDDVVVGYQVHSDGTIKTREGVGSSYATKETWIGNCDNDEYECKLVVNSGDNPTSGPALNTWLLCSTTRTWELFFGGFGALSNNCTISFRRVLDDVGIGSATVTMTIEVGV